MAARPHPGADFTSIRAPCQAFSAVLTETFSTLGLRLFLRESPRRAIKSHKRGRREMQTTARQIIEARLGRPLGPLGTMPLDLRKALYLLALQLVKVKRKRR